jgi:hypothetical protein
MEGSHSIKVDSEVYLVLNTLKLDSQRIGNKKHSSINSVLREVLELKNE